MPTSQLAKRKVTKNPFDPQAKPIAHEQKREAHWLPYINEEEPHNPIFQHDDPSSWPPLVGDPPPTPLKVKRDPKKKKDSKTDDENDSGMSHSALRKDAKAEEKKWRKAPSGMSSDEIEANSVIPSEYKQAKKDYKWLKTHPEEKNEIERAKFQVGHDEDVSERSYTSTQAERNAKKDSDWTVSSMRDPNSASAKTGHSGGFMNRDLKKDSKAAEKKWGKAPTGMSSDQIEDNSVTKMESKLLKDLIEDRKKNPGKADEYGKAKFQTGTREDPSDD